MTAPAPTTRPSRVVAVVPVKGLASGKSRLATALSPARRVDLLLATLRRVLDALVHPAIVARIVVSPDPAVRDAAHSMDACFLPQVASGAADGLNAALDQARRSAPARDATALLAVLGDLPLLSRADVAALLALAEAPRCAALAPDRHETGTNALLLRPPDALPFLFGAGSFARFRAAATASGVVVRDYRAPGTALDLDTPADLAYLAALAPSVVPGAAIAPTESRR